MAVGRTACQRGHRGVLTDALFDAGLATEWCTTRNHLVFAHLQYSNRVNIRRAHASARLSRSAPSTYLYRLHADLCGYCRAFDPDAKLRTADYHGGHDDDCCGRAGAMELALASWPRNCRCRFYGGVYAVAARRRSLSWLRLACHYRGGLRRAFCGSVGRALPAGDREPDNGARDQS